MTDKEGESLEDIIKKIDDSLKYKVLTKEEYEKLLYAARNPVSTPRVSIPPGGQMPLFDFRAPGVSPIPRLQQTLNNSAAQNTSYAAPTFNPPKLPFFSGSEEPQKGETTYEVWNFEVKCLQSSEYLPEHVLLQSIRNSLRGEARSLLVPLGEKASVAEILTKLDGFYGNVSSGETLIQSFYNDFQKENETIVAYGSRLEQTLSRAIRCGHMELAAKDSMLRSKFWTGLKSQQLRNSTRHLYDSIKDFQLLLREIRKVEQEESSSTRSAPKQKVVQQHSGQVPTDQSDSSKEILKQMSELMGRMKSLEQRLETQQQTLAAANSQPLFQQQNFNPQNQRGAGRGFRGQARGSFGRGNFGRGNDRGNFQNNWRGGFRGGRFRGGGRGGTNGRGANRGDGTYQSDQPLN